jgi:hypothetical protein
MVPKDDTSPPIGKRHERYISIQQAQDVSLMAGKRHEQPISIQRVQDVSLIGSVQRLLARSGGLVRATVAGVVARLRRGRPPYERAPITAVVEEALAGGVLTRHWIILSAGSGACLSYEAFLRPEIPC